MKKIIIALVALSSLHTFADSQIEKLTIKEVKEHVKTINQDSTCLDEYLSRRKELIIKLSLAPVVAAAGTVAGGYTGAMTGAGMASAASLDGWGVLGYAVFGEIIGGAGGAVTVVADAAVTGVTLSNNILITKTVAEQELGREGVYTEKLYNKYLKKSQIDHSKEEFLTKLLEANVSGKLCDGTMVKQPKIKIGTKLKYKVAKLKDLVKYIDSI